jgi:16S rRNA (uracil1498-N3)-methyltransferase
VRYRLSHVGAIQLTQAGAMQWRICASCRRVSVHNRGVSARFYAPGAQASGDLVTLSEDEAQHLTKVLRLKAGAAVRAFNGRGAEFDAAVERATKTVVTLRLKERRASVPEPRVAITLVQAVLKGDKMDDVVRDAVMMGVATIQPVVSERSEVALATLTRGKRRQRWERIAISSAKQCGRAVVPAILEPCALRDLLWGLAGGRPPLPALMLVEPGGLRALTSLDEVGAASIDEATLMAGPEGGWAPQELDEAARVCQFVTFGSGTLRADAAALVGLSALFAVWRAF